MPDSLAYGGMPRRSCDVVVFLVAAVLLSAPLHAQQIVTDGRTDTRLSVQGHVTDITTDTITGNNAINSFARFNVESGNVVNLHIPDAAVNLVNIVRDERTSIHGILNAIQNGEIGGNVWFANPHGFIVGRDGVVNAGALTVRTPTQQFVDDFFMAPGMSVQQLVDGSVENSADSEIKVDGQINASRSISLYTGTLNVGGALYSGARFVGAAPDFSDVVNANGVAVATNVVVENGRILVVADNDVRITGTMAAQGGVITVAAGRDIEVSGDAVVSVAGAGPASDGGTVVMMAERNARLADNALIDASAGETGDGGFIEFSARDTVTLSGGELAAGAPGGQAGSILIDPEHLVIDNTTAPGVRLTGGANATFQADETLTVAAGTVISSRDIANVLGGNHLADASTGNSGNLTFISKVIEVGLGAQILAHADGTFTGGDVRFEATASGGELAMFSDTVARVSLYSATVRGRDIIVVVNAAHISTIPPIVTKGVSAIIELVGATLQASRDINLAATANLSVSTPTILPLATVDSDVTASVDVSGATQITAGRDTILTADATVGLDLKPGLPDFGELPGDAGVAIALIRSTATVDVAGTSQLSVFRELVLAATNTVDIEAVTDASAAGDTAVGGTLSLAVVTTETRAAIGGSAVVTNAGSVDVTATSINRIIASATASTGGAEEKGDPSESETQTALADYEDETATADEGGDTGGGVQVAAAVAISDIGSTTQASLGSSGALTATGPVTVSSRALNQSNVTGDGSSAAGDVGIGVGVAVNVVRATNDAWVSQSVNSIGLIIQALMAGVLETNQYSASASSGAGASDVGIAGAVAVNIVENRTRARLMGTAVVAAGGGNVAVNATNESTSTSKAVPTEDGGVSGDSVGIGASVALNVITNQVIASFEDSSQVTGANNLELTAVGAHTINTEAEAGAEGGVSVTPVAAVAVVDNATIARIGTSGTGLTLDGGATISATHSSTVTTTAKGSAKGETAAIGLAVGVAVVSDRAIATIDRNLTGGGDIVVLAAANQAVSTSVTASAAGGKGEEDGDGDDGVDQKIAAQTQAGKNKQAAGSANASQEPGSASTSEGGVSVAAAVAVNASKSTATAAIGAGLTVSTTGSVDVAASHNTDVIAVADGSAVAADGGGGATVGIGAAVIVNLAETSAIASIGIGANVTGNGVAVRTFMTDVGGDTVHTFSSEASAGAGGEKVGIAGALALNIIDVQSLAEIHDGAVINAATGDVEVSAANNTSIAAKALPTENGGASGDQVGVGASAALNLFNNDITRARVGANAAINDAGAVTVSATSNTNSVAEAEGGAAGSVAVDAVVALTELKQQSEALVAFGPELNTNGAVSITATATGNHTANATGDVKSSKVGVGASAAIIISNSDTLASLDRNVDTGAGAGSHLTVSADAVRTYEAIAKASAGGANDSDDLSEDDKNNAKSTSTLASTEDAQDETSKVDGNSGGGKVNVAAAAAVIVLDDDVTATIAPSRVLAVGGDLTVNASNQVDFSARGLGDALDADLSPTNLKAPSKSGAVGIGVGVGIVVATNDTAASLGNGVHVTQAGNITVSAESLQNTTPAFVNKLATEGVAGAGADKVAVAGALALTYTESTTSASFGTNVRIDDADAVIVSADNTSKLSAKAWSGAVSSKVGIGASVALIVSKNEYTASIGASGDITADSLAVTATNHKVSGPVPFDFEIDDLFGDDDSKAITDANLQVILGQNNYYTEAIAGAGGNQVAISGAFAINVFKDSTLAWIAENTEVVTTGALEVTAGSDVLAKAFSGGVAVSGKVGVGLASSDIVNTSITRAWVGGGVDLTGGSIAIDASAIMDLTVISASAAAASTAGVSGVLSLILSDNTVEAYTGIGAMIDSGSTFAVSAANDLILLNIAGVAGIGGTAGVGAAAGINLLDNTTQAWIGAGSEVEAAGLTSVDARSGIEVLSVTVAGAGGGTAGVAAGGGVNVYNPVTQAWIGAGAQVNAVDALVGQSVRVWADSDINMMTIVGSLGIGGTAGVGGAADVVVVNPITKAWIAGVGTTVRARNNLRVLADSSERINSFGMGLGGGGTVGVQGSASVISLTPDTQAWIAGGVTAFSTGNLVVAAYGETEIDMVAGAVALGGTAGVGASAAVLVLDKTVKALIADTATVTALGAGAGTANVATGGFNISFVDFTVDQQVQPAGLDADSQAAGGDHVTKNRNSNRELVAIRGLAVTATSKDTIRSLSIAGAVAGTVAVTLGGNVLVLDADIEASIGNVQVNAVNTGAHAEQSVLVAAGSDLYHLGITGSAAGAGAVGVGAGADVAVINYSTVAKIDASANVTARRDVNVLAKSKQDLVSIAAAFGVGGSVGVAGAVGVIDLRTATHAYIGSSATVNADGNVRVAAIDDSEIVLVVGSLGVGFGTAGVGMSVAVTSVTKDTKAFVGSNATVNARGGLVFPPGETPGDPPLPDGGEVEAIEPGVIPEDPDGDLIVVPPVVDGTSDMQVITGDDFSSRTGARGLSVEASSSEDITVVAIAGAGGLFAGVGGAVSVEVITSVTQAFIGDSADINTSNANANPNQDVNVTARNYARLMAIDGALAGGAVGVSGAVDIGLIRNSTSAYIGAGAEVHANRDVDVNALSDRTIESYVVSAAGGIVGITAGVGVYSVGGSLDAETMGRLSPEDGNGSAQGDADDQAANDGVTNVLLGGNCNEDNDCDEGFTDPRITNIANRAAAARAGVSVSGDLTTSPVSGNSAYIGNGATVRAGRHVDIDAREVIEFEMLAGAVAGGAVGLGAGVGVATFNSNNTAYIGDNAIVEAAKVYPVGNITVTAELDSDVSGKGFAGSGGVVAIDAAIISFSDTSVISATVGSGAQLVRANEIRIEAIDGRKLDAEGYGASVGAVAAGAVVAIADLGGSVTASLGNSTLIGQGAGLVGEVTVLAQSIGFSKAQTTSARAGIGLAASGSAATATYDPTVTASVGASSNITTVTGIQVTAVATPEVVANAYGFNVSGGVGVGASVALANSAPTVTAEVFNNAQFHGGGLSVLAQSQPVAGKQGVSAHATGASGGLLAGVNATIAESKSSAHVIARLGNAVRLPDSDVLVRANNVSSQYAQGFGIAAGFYAAGANDVLSSSNNTTQATIGTGTLTNAGRNGQLGVSAEGYDLNTARSEAGSGGVVAGNASSASTSDTSTVTASIGGNATLNVGTLVVDAVHTDDFSLSATSVNAAAVGASGSFAQHDANSTVNATLGGSLVINSFGAVVVSANNTFIDSASGERASGAGGGVASGAAVFSATTLTGSSNVTVGNSVTINSGTDPVLNPGGIQLVAASFVTIDEDVSLASGGVLAGAHAESRATTNVTNTVTVGTGNTWDSQGHVGVGTFTVGLIGTSSMVNTWGGAAVGSSHSSSNFTTNQTVNIGNTIDITAFGNIDITAGKDPGGYYETLVSAAANAQGYVRGVIAIPSASARSNITTNSTLNVGTGTIRSGLNTILGAYRGSAMPGADGVGRGKAFARRTGLSFQV